MSIKSYFFLKFAQWKVAKEWKTHEKATLYQTKLLSNLVHENRNSIFGKDHKLDSIRNYSDFRACIPIRNYEDFLPYIERIKSDERNVLRKKDPLYLLMTSGTTAGSKYIPISKSGIKYQIDAALKVLCFYAVNKKSAEFMNHKMIFLQGSPELDHANAIPSGRLSGVVYHHIPKFFQQNKLPSYAINIISDWQEKLTKIVEETFSEDISILGGIPPWCIQYFEKLLSKTKVNNLKSLYPNLEMYIHGGLDYSNYKEKVSKLLGENVTCLQTFPASEGFFALQDQLDADDMLLLLNQGIFYEFRSFNSDLENVITIDKVELHTRYELVITNDSGLYRYAMGDLIEFTSISPYRIRVVGRTSQFISAFGEHVIAYEVEKAVERASATLELEIEDYYVYADVENKQYVWQMEFKETYTNDKIVKLTAQLDRELSSLNKYYSHLIYGQIINPSKLDVLDKNSFQSYREKLGKSGGQNKIVRLGLTKIHLV